MKAFFLDWVFPPPPTPHSPLHSPPPLLPLPFSGLSASSTSSLTAEGKGPEGCQI